MQSSNVEGTKEAKTPLIEVQGPSSMSLTNVARSVNAVDPILLESYNVYSHTKDRTTSQFYIMKCSKLINEGFIQLPIKDLMESVRGPLLEKSSNSWKVTPQVKYFHMLPYCEIIS
ncbi:hypothetical protein P8452_56768 [Trifolium repens]|nr:hypothetical protein P8452_56768 [Trifolium repens]